MYCTFKPKVVPVPVHNSLGGTFYYSGLLAGGWQVCPEQQAWVGKTLYPSFFSEPQALRFRSTRPCETGAGLMPQALCLQAPQD